MYLQILLFHLLNPCKITILIVHLRVELNFLWHILYQSQMPYQSHIAHLSILDVMILGNSFLGLNINSNDLWSLLKRIFFPIKNCQVLVVIHTMAKASFSISEWLNSVFVSLLGKYIIGCPSCDNIPDIEYNNTSTSIVITPKNA